MSSNIAQKVEAIWRDVLSVPSGQEGATFFELGGDSVSAVRLTSRVEEELGVLIDVGDMFEDPDLPEFVTMVTGKAEEASAA